MQTKLKHTFFHNSIAAFLGDFSVSIQPYRDLISADLPVSIANSGDEVFLATMLFKTEEDRKKLYAKNPRINFSIGNIGSQTDNYTSPHVLGKFVNEHDSGTLTAKRAEVRRTPTIINMSYDFKFTNIDQYLKFVDVMLTISGVARVFEFEYMGAIYTGSYKLTTNEFDKNTNFTLGFDTERRNSMTNSVEVTVNFPAFNVYPNNGIAGNNPDVFDENQRMNKLIHNVYINGNESLVSRTIIPKS